MHALVREDGSSQVEVAELLGRHKSWICRRLALIERLGPEARDELRVGLLSPTAARQLVRLPPGNQPEFLQLMQREALSGTELAGVVELLLECSGRSQQEYILGRPREALSQLKGVVLCARDPRLSSAGNQIWKRVGLLLGGPAGPHRGVADTPWPYRTHARRSSHLVVSFPKVVARGIRNFRAYS